MKKIIVFLLLLNVCTVTATTIGTDTGTFLDTRRETVHVIDENFLVSSHYTDFFYGEVAADVQGILDSYEEDYDYITTRVPYGFVVEEWTVNSSQDYLEINIWGRYDNYIAKKNDIYKIGGKGFIDRLCTDFPVQTVPRIVQEFYSTVILPEDLNVLMIPQSSAGEFNTVYYEYEAWQQDNELHEYVLLEVKYDADIFSYCVEREEIDLVLQQGFIATTESLFPDYIFWIFGVSFIIIIVLVMAVVLKR